MRNRYISITNSNRDISISHTDISINGINAKFARHKRLVLWNCLQQPFKKATHILFTIEWITILCGHIYSKLENVEYGHLRGLPKRENSDLLTDIKDCISTFDGTGAVNFSLPIFSNSLKVPSQFFLVCVI